MHLPIEEGEALRQGSVPLGSLLVTVLQPVIRLHRGLACSVTAEQALKEPGRFLAHPRAVSTVDEWDQGVAVLQGALPPRGLPGGFGICGSLQVIVGGREEIWSGRDRNIKGPLCPFRAGRHDVSTVGGTIVGAHQFNLFNANMPSRFSCEFSPGIA